MGVGDDENVQLFLCNAKKSFHSHTKSFMSIQPFGTEKSHVELDQVLGGMHPNRLITMVFVFIGNFEND